MLLNNYQILMSNFLSFVGSKMRKPSSFNQEVPTNTPKFFQKKSLISQFDLQNLRETDTTLNPPSPKNKKALSSNDFQFIKFLGNGKFGAVYLVMHRQTGFLFALKMINKSAITTVNEQQSAKILNQLIRQIKIQIFLNHRNLIKLYSFFSDEYKIYLLMQLACDGQLYQKIKNNVKLSEQAVSYLIRQTLEGVKYLHDHSVIHRDLKPQNIVLIHGVPKICDFGWSVYCPQDFRNTLCGTPLYLSPQMLKGDQYNFKIDSWAIGTLTYQLITNTNPFRITKKSQIGKILTEEIVLPNGSPNLRDFLNLTLQKQPKNRISSKKMLQHPFITKYSQIQTSEELCISSKSNNKIQKQAKLKFKNK